MRSKEGAVERLGGWAVLALTLGFALATAGSASAQEDSVDEATVDLYQWSAGTVEEQLAADTTAVPAGRGAVFVPAMSDPSDEPEVAITQGGSRVAGGPTGQRILVAPGEYTVRVGSGSLQQMAMLTNVTVTEGETFVASPFWGALRVEVVNENNIPHRGDYELIRVRDRELYGLGLGADTLQGERILTWLLPSGVYRIVQPGANYRTRTNFTTVYVPEGGLVHFKLVLDEETNDLLGAGVVTSAELGVAEGVSNWSRTLTIGLNAGLSHTSAVVGLPNQVTINGDLFLDSYVNYDDGPHFFAGIFELEEGFLQVRPEVGDALPLQKSRDRLRIDLLYTYFLNDWVGPYARLGLVTGLFPTEIVVTEDTTVVRNNADGTLRETELVTSSNSFNVGGALSPLQVREGLGFNFRLLRTNWAAVNFRLGAGFRQNFFNDAFVLDDDAATTEIEYIAIENFNEEGLEAILTANLRFSRWIIYTTEAEYFSDFNEFDNPTVDWQNTLSFRLASFLSLDYNVDLLYFPQTVKELQLSQNVLLRFSWDLL